MHRARDAPRRGLSLRSSGESRAAEAPAPGDGQATFGLDAHPRTAGRGVPGFLDKSDSNLTPDAGGPRDRRRVLGQRGVHIFALLAILLCPSRARFLSNRSTTEVAFQLAFASWSACFIAKGASGGVGRRVVGGSTRGRVRTNAAGPGGGRRVWVRRVPLVRRDGQERGGRAGLPDTGGPGPSDASAVRAADPVRRGSTVQGAFAEPVDRDESAAGQRGSGAGTGARAGAHGGARAGAAEPDHLWTVRVPSGLPSGSTVHPVRGLPSFESSTHASDATCSVYRLPAAAHVSSWGPARPVCVLWDHHGDAAGRPAVHVHGVLRLRRDAHARGGGCEGAVRSVWGPHGDGRGGAGGRQPEQGLASQGRLRGAAGGDGDGPGYSQAELVPVVALLHFVPLLPALFGCSARPCMQSFERELKST